MDAKRRRKEVYGEKQEKKKEKKKNKVEEIQLAKFARKPRKQKSYLSGCIREPNLSSIMIVSMIFFTHVS